jgi:hypothetical protein
MTMDSLTAEERAHDFIDNCFGVYSEVGDGCHSDRCVKLATQFRQAEAAAEQRGAERERETNLRALKLIMSTYQATAWNAACQFAINTIRARGKE